MNIPERIDDPLEGIRTVFDGMISEVQTGMPGIIVDFNPDHVTATVQPAIQGRQTLPSGQTQPITLPQLLDVPVEFPSGGGATLTFPVKKGDECWISFSSRDLSSWWQSGGVQPPIEPRKHDLSDAVCRVGVRSKSRPLTGGVHLTNTEFRADDGSRKISIDPGGDIHIYGVKIIIETEANLVIQATGTVDIQSPKLTHNGHSIGADHKHINVAKGTATSGPPE